MSGFGGWRFAIALALALAIGPLASALVASTLLMTLLAQAVISAIFATSIGVLIRQSGLISFGHAAFYGLAAYLLGLFVKHGVLAAHWAILAAVLLPTLIALGLGLVIVRIPGVAFSMITLAVGQVVYEIFFKWRALANGDDGLAIRFPAEILGVSTRVLQKPQTMFIVAWSVLVLVIALLHILSRSHFGRLTEAIRDNEERARFIGYQTVWPRALVYALSAMIASLAGVLFALYNAFVSPEALHWTLSGAGLVMAIIGGARWLIGPALGALILFLLKDLLGDVTEHWQGFVGLILIAVTLWMPVGVAGGALNLWRRIFVNRSGKRASP
jgi:branched-chain amino acid transport system permease protein